MKNHPKIAIFVRLATLFLIQGALTIFSISILFLYLLPLYGLAALVAAYFAVDCKSDCVKWWILLLPGQYIANMLLLYVAAGMYDDPFPAVVLFFLAAQAAGVGLRKLRMRVRLTKRDFAELDSPEEPAEHPDRPEPGILRFLKNPDFLRLGTISCMQALFVHHADFLVFLAMFGIHSLTGLEGPVLTLGYALYAAIPLLLGIFAIGSAKWWLISLPVQLLLDVAVQSSPLTERIERALFFLAVQAVGVGIKALWLKRKAKTTPKT